MILLTMQLNRTTTKNFLRNMRFIDNDFTKCSLRNIELDDCQHSGLYHNNSKLQCPDVRRRTSYIARKLQSTYTDVA